MWFQDTRDTGTPNTSLISSFSAEEFDFHKGGQFPHNCIVGLDEEKMIYHETRADTDHTS